MAPTTAGSGTGAGAAAFGAATGVPPAAAAAAAGARRLRRPCTFQSARRGRPAAPRAAAAPGPGPRPAGPAPPPPEAEAPRPRGRAWPTAEQVWAAHPDDIDDLVLDDDYYASFAMTKDDALREQLLSNYEEDPDARPADAAGGDGASGGGGDRGGERALPPGLRQRVQELEPYGPEVRRRRMPVGAGGGRRCGGEARRASCQSEGRDCRRARCASRTQTRRAAGGSTRPPGPPLRPPPPPSTSPPRPSHVP
jgi:hypothetical protein